jgi:hypothetical protein
LKIRFDAITIDNFSITPDEWYLYEGCVKAAEAFSRTILIKSCTEVVGFINRLCGCNLEPGDFTGDIKISYLGQETLGLKYEVGFGLTPKAMKNHSLQNSVKLSILALHKVLPKDLNTLDNTGTLFEYKGNRYFVKVFDQ